MCSKHVIVCVCVCVGMYVCECRCLCLMVGLCSQIISSIETVSCWLLQMTAKLAHKNPSILLSPREHLEYRCATMSNFPMGPHTCVACPLSTESSPQPATSASLVTSLLDLLFIFYHCWYFGFCFFFCVCVCPHHAYLLACLPCACMCMCV